MDVGFLYLTSLEPKAIHVLVALTYIKLNVEEHPWNTERALQNVSEASAEEIMVYSSVASMLKNGTCRSGHSLSQSLSASQCDVNNLMAALAGRKLRNRSKES
ncbi:hypothetical protein VNO77_43947 [Canavalia gladiata]|uniref:Uncharacterized protein n=1 Tax=Canavalia gladiata TaxID=3824 RepID=A0AAN9PQI4_CANGL